MSPRRRTSLVLPAAVLALALAACSDDGGDGGDKADDDTVACDSGTVGAGQGQAGADAGALITSYDADYRIAGDGAALEASETITVELDDASHHGIFRDFDDDELIVADVSGTVDGKPQAQVGPGAGGGPRLTLGHPDKTLKPGEHVFDIAFEASSVLQPATEVDQDWQFAATVIGSDWAIDIEEAEVRIELPDGSSGDVVCTVGPGASAIVAGVGTSTLVLTADEVPAGSGVHVVAGTDVDPYE